MSEPGAESDEGSTTVRRLRHVPELDGLRGMAVLVVVVFHAFGILTPLAKQYLPNGFLGVDLFFVLSGFLITALLLGEHGRNGQISFGRFYRRRALRLLPAIVLLLVAHGIYVLIEGESRSIELSTQLSAFFYYANWQSIFGKINTDLGHLWSLSLEEQFYLVWPLTLLGLMALFAVVRRISVIVGILVACVVAVAVWRIVLWNGGTPPLHLYVRTDTRADSLLIGALLAILWTHGLTPRRGMALAATAAVALLGYLIVTPIGLREPFFHMGGFTLVAIAAALVILAALESKWFGNMVLRFKPLCAVGVVSYGLYLWHLPVINIVAENSGGWERWQRFALAFAATGVITAMSWFLLERPFLKWKDRLERRSASRAPEESGRTEPGSPVDVMTATTH